MSDRCKSPRCPRPGTNSAGYCCHGCAANARFGASLIHRARCENANPGAEETTATSLRTQVAEVVYTHMATAADQPGTTAARIIREVMEAVESRLSELEAEADRTATGDPWDFGYAQALKDMRGET